MIRVRPGRRAVLSGKAGRGVDQPAEGHDPHRSLRSVAPGTRRVSHLAPISATPGSSCIGVTSWGGSGLRVTRPAGGAKAERLPNTPPFNSPFVAAAFFFFFFTLLLFFLVSLSWIWSFQHPVIMAGVRHRGYRRLLKATLTKKTRGFNEGYPREISEAFKDTFRK